MKKVGRLFLVLFLLFSITGCDTWDDWFNDDDDDEDEEITQTLDTSSDTDDTDDTDDDTDTTEKSTLRYSHYNPSAWKGRGSALVLCSNSPSMSSCSVGGTSLAKHGSLDKGRVVWTVWNSKGLSGRVKCFSGDTKYTATVSGSGLQFGSCSK